MKIPRRLILAASGLLFIFIWLVCFTSQAVTAGSAASSCSIPNFSGPTNISLSNRNQLVNDLTNNAKTRAQVLRTIAENPNVVSAEFNRAFVLMQYFGYLRCNPNDAPDSDYTGSDFWLTKLNQFNGDYVAAEMVKAFINSSEYRNRFGP